MNALDPSKPSFANLPLEIRQQFYDYHFASSSGYLTAVRNGPRLRGTLSSRQKWPFQTIIPPATFLDERVEYSLLLTCKHIHSEAKDVIFTQNTWVVLQPSSLPWQFPHKTPLLKLRVRHLWMDLNIMGFTALADARNALKALAEWNAQGGVLQSITLGVLNDVEDFIGLEDLRLFGARRSGESFWTGYLRMLRRSRERYGWGAVRRKLEFQVEYFPKSFREPGDMLLDLHEGFGGEVWFNGQLCCRDGEVLLKPRVKDWRGDWRLFDLKARGGTLEELPLPKP